MRRIFLILQTIILTTVTFISCKREKKDFIGPDLDIASANFQITSPFALNTTSVAFTSNNVWANASFNERVSWILKFKGLTSGAEKTITGTSTSLSATNTLWTGGHSGLYFFRQGEQAVAELTIFGVYQKSYDTVTITAEKSNYGSNAILWWDMGLNGVAKQGTVYWYDFYDTNEKVLDTIYSAQAPLLQGAYRAIEGEEGKGPTPYYIMALSHTPLSPYSFPVTTPVGFNAPLEDIYLNFYVRRRTNSAGLGGAITSILIDYDQTVDSTLVDSISVLSFEAGTGGTITWEGWKLVSIRLADMEKDPATPASFDPSKIGQIRFDLGIRNGNNQTGVDIDFIVFTRGKPFDPDDY